MEIHEAFVYKWTNLTNGHFYIGYHKGTLNDGYICSSKSKRFWDDFKNPLNNWSRDILYTGTCDDCVKEELRLLNELDLMDEKVYNNSKGGGIIFNKEVREKMSLIKQGKKRKPITKETREKMSLAKKGKTYSLESRKRMSEGMKGRIPWNKGIELNEDLKRKLSISAQHKPRKHLDFYNMCLSEYKMYLNDNHIKLLNMYVSGVIISDICKDMKMAPYQVFNTLRTIKTIINKINPTLYHTQCEK